MSDMRRREFTALVGGVGLLLAIKVRRARAAPQAFTSRGSRSLSGAFLASRSS